MSDQPIPDPGQSDPDIPTQINEGGGRPIGSGGPRMPKGIGQYALKRVIASGGMGTVYEAVQEHPRRTVALKVMKHGIASRSALRRFEYESQILARLQLRNIRQRGRLYNGRRTCPAGIMRGKRP